MKAEKITKREFLEKMRELYNQFILHFDSCVYEKYADLYISPMVYLFDDYDSEIEYPRAILTESYITFEGLVCEYNDKMGLEHYTPLEDKEAIEYFKNKAFENLLEFSGNLGAWIVRQMELIKIEES